MSEEKKKMTLDEFFKWFEEYCRHRHYGMSAQTVLMTADEKGIDLGHISYVGKKHLLPRGWTRHITKSGNSFYLPPEKKETEVNEL